jgi:hypothetical protein
MCQPSEGSLEGPFPPESWEKSADEASKRAEDADLKLCVDTSWDRSTSHVGLASWRDDGDLHVEVVASRTGTEWVIPWLIAHDRAEAIRSAPVAVQGKGAPATSLIEGMREAGIDVVAWTGPDLGAACGRLYDRVRAAVGEGESEHGLRHRNQPVLNLAAATASTRPLQDSWVWDRRRSPVDAAPLIAITGAAWLLERREETPPEPRIRTIGG